MSPMSRSLFAAAPALVGLAFAVCAGLAPVLPVLAAPPTGLAVSVQKDAADSPLYALVSWQSSAGGIYEVQKAYIASAGAQRNWETVTASPASGADGRLTLRDSYEVGRGGVCYRVRTSGETDYTAEACSPIPPTSSAPGAPNTGNSVAAVESRQLMRTPFLIAIAAGVLGVIAVSAGRKARRP